MEFDHRLAGIVLIHGWGSGGSIREESIRTQNGSSWRTLDCQHCRAGKVCGRDAELCLMGERELADPCRVGDTWN
jgi:hypothetical protein